MDDLSTLSVGELKRRIRDHGLSIGDAIEKQDLINILRSASTPSTGSSQISMSVSDLRDLCRSLAGRTSQCTEKSDLFDMARSLLSNKTCTVCLGALLADYSERVHRYPCCGSYLHTKCVAEWIIVSDKYPPVCPSCKEVLEDKFIDSYIISPKFSTPAQVRRYSLLMASHASLRGRSSAHPSSAAERREMENLGLRQCPGCSSWIEKGPAMEAFGTTIAEGCDKMTCRCGCQFCYRCGSIGAKCNCTPDEHGFFSHQDVIREYPNSNISSPAGFFNRNWFH